MTKSAIALIKASAQISAPAEKLYSIIADYRNGHPRILPKEFSGLEVEKGGVGAGTIIRFQMRAFGTTRKFHAAVTEPQPGRVLVETYFDTNGAVTTFTVERRSADESDVTISTEMPVRSGLLGAIERFLNVRYLRSIYRRELALLATAAKQ